MHVETHPGHFPILHASPSLKHCFSTLCTVKRSLYKRSNARQAGVQCMPIAQIPLNLYFDLLEICCGFAVMLQSITTCHLITGLMTSYHIVSARLQQLANFLHMATV